MLLQVGFVGYTTISRSDKRATDKNYFSSESTLAPSKDNITQTMPEVVISATTSTPQVPLRHSWICKNHIDEKEPLFAAQEFDTKNQHISLSQAMEDNDTSECNNFGPDDPGIVPHPVYQPLPPNTAQPPVKVELALHHAMVPSASQKPTGNSVSQLNPSSPEDPNLGDRLSDRGKSHYQHGVVRKYFPSRCPMLTMKPVCLVVRSLTYQKYARFLLVCNKTVQLSSR